MPESHDLWRYVHILLLTFWLGADVGVYLTMIFVKDRRLSFDTRVTLIKLAFYIDLFPRACFALFIPVGLQLAGDLALLEVGTAGRVAAWLIALAWVALHFAIIRMKGTPAAKTLSKLNIAFEAVAGFVCVGYGLYALSSQEGPADWFAAKVLLFGLIFWIVLGIDTTFQPFSMILRMSREGATESGEAAVTRTTNLTLAWAMLLYLLIAAIAFLGTVKPV